MTQSNEKVRFQRGLEALTVADIAFMTVRQGIGVFQVIRINAASIYRHGVVKPTTTMVDARTVNELESRGYNVLVFNDKMEVVGGMEECTKCGHFVRNDIPVFQGVCLHCRAHVCSR